MKKHALFFILSWVTFMQVQALPSPAKLPLCVSCHGLIGISTNPQWPNLNAQHKDYFIKQIEDMKNNTNRKVPLMYPLIKDLSLQEIDDIARYYAKMPLNQVVDNKKISTEGKKLYNKGDYNKGILACSMCHNPNGKGNAQAGFPVLAKQHASYIVHQLLAFKQKKRSNDLNKVMQDICSRMTVKEMKAVALYIEGLKE